MRVGDCNVPSRIHQKSEPAAGWLRARSSQAGVGGTEGASAYDRTRVRAAPQDVAPGVNVRAVQDASGGWWWWEGGAWVAGTAPQGLQRPWFRCGAKAVSRPVLGGEWGPRCRCGDRLVWEGQWRCDGCGRVPVAGYAAMRELPRALPPEASEGVPVFRSSPRTNCDTGGQYRDWLLDVEWLTSWFRKSRAARLRVRGTVPGPDGEPVLRRWHADRMRGQAERFERVRQCGGETGLEWVCEETGERCVHRSACGCWRVCRRCLQARRKRLQTGVSGQRLVALATHEKRMRKHYAGREGRWSERLITFTVPHSEVSLDAHALPKLWRALEAPWRRHLEKQRGMRVRVAGPDGRKRLEGPTQVWVRAIEIAPPREGDPTGGHAHLHVWVLGPYVEHALLRVWWGRALESLGYQVPHKDVAEVIREARDKRTAEWLGDVSTVPWPVVDVRRATSEEVSRYAVKTGVVTYITKGEKCAERLEPAHAARVYQALEGVRVVQWARGWAPKKQASRRWFLRRARARVGAQVQWEREESGVVVRETTEKATSVEVDTS